MQPEKQMKPKILFIKESALLHLVKVIKKALAKRPSEIALKSSSQISRERHVTEELLHLM